MRQLLLLVLLSGCLSVRAQIYLDSLPPGPIRLDSPVTYTLPATQIQTGYGQQELSTFNGAVTHLEARQFNQGQINDWNQLWQAQVPGFTVARAGSNPNEAMEARIRGLRTMSYGNTKPLYVVDGVPGVDLFAVDPSDIVAVDILRGAASTAIYGGRGSAGVVLITTKPAAVGPLKIQYAGQVSVESAAKRYTVLNEARFLELGGQDYSPGFVANTDWQDLVLQSGVSHAHHLSVSKGLGQGFIKAGLHYREVTGILRASGFEQHNGSLLASQRFWRDRLNITAGATLGQRNSNYGFPEAYRHALATNSSSPVRSDDAEYIPYGGYVNKPFYEYANPVAILEQNANTGRTDFYLLHARAELAVWRNLTASVQVSQQQNTLQDRKFYSPFSSINMGGLGEAISEKTAQKNLESTLNYRFHTTDWQGDILAGYGWYQTKETRTNVSAYKTGDDPWTGKTWQQYADYLTNSPNRDLDYRAFYNNLRSDRQLIAFFGRAQLQWQNTYFGTFSWRKEGSSNLSPNTRWGIFPAFTLGVDLNKWLQFRSVDYLKVNVGHGMTGTEITQSALYQRVFKGSNFYRFYYNGQYLPAYAISQNPNDHLGWERTTENSLDIRFSLWGGRLQGAVNWYRARNRDLIRSVYKPIPPNFANVTIENVGETAEKGIELALNYAIIKSQNLTWEVSLSATQFVNTLEKTGYGTDTVANATVGCGCTGNYQLLYPGVAIGTFWGPILTEIDKNGFQTYQDINRNGITGGAEIGYYKADQTRLGDAQPAWQLGFSQKLTWRNLDLNFLLQAVTGHQIAHEYRIAYEIAPTGFNTIVTQYYNPTLKNTQFSSAYVENGSFLRMQYLSLGYRLHLNNKWFHSLHFQIGAQNLFTVTNYSGLDPELRLRDTGSRSFGSRSYRDYEGDRLAPGIDRRGTYPTARRWWLGVQAEF